MSPSPDCADDMEPLASTTPAVAVRGKMVVDVLEPSVVGVAHRGHAELPAGVLTQPIATPIGDVERRIGEDEVGLEVLQLVLVEATLVVPADVGVDTAHREVHLGKPPGRVVALLPVNGDVADAPAVFLDELLGLDEHAAGAAAGVIDAALVGLQHLDQQPDDGAGRVELAAALALGAGEAAEEVLIDPSENVAGAVGLLGHADPAHKVNQLAEHDSC